MNLYQKILTNEEKLSLIGLGYVGLPIAVAFAEKVNVIGFDINVEKINLYKSGIDPCSLQKVHKCETLENKVNAFLIQIQEFIGMFCLRKTKYWMKC